MQWKNFKDTKVEVGDILLMKSGSLAFADTTCGASDPMPFDRISSIPEGWSYSFDDVYKYPKSSIRKSGWYYDIYGKRVDKIEKVMKLSKYVKRSRK